MRPLPGLRRGPVPVVAPGSRHHCLGPAGQARPACHRGRAAPPRQRRPDHADARHARQARHHTGLHSRWRQPFCVYDLDVRDVADLLHSAEAFEAFRRQAQQLAAWHQTDRHGRRSRGRVSPHRHINSPTAQRLWATPLYRLIYDLDGRTWRDRFRGRLLHRRRTGLLTAYAALPGLQCVIELRDALAWIPVPRCWQKARSPAYRTWAH